MDGVCLSSTPMLHPFSLSLSLFLCLSRALYCKHIFLLARAHINTRSKKKREKKQMCMEGGSEMHELSFNKGER